MINPYHANVIDMLREAAKEHGAVADLLECLSEGFTFFTSGELEIRRMAKLPEWQVTPQEAIPQPASSPARRKTGR